MKILIILFSFAVTSHVFAQAGWIDEHDGTNYKITIQRNGILYLPAKKGPTSLAIGDRIAFERQPKDYALLNCPPVITIVRNFDRSVSLTRIQQESGPSFWDDVGDLTGYIANTFVNKFYPPEEANTKGIVSGFKKQVSPMPLLDNTTLFWDTPLQLQLSGSGNEQLIVLDSKNKVLHKESLKIHGEFSIFPKDYGMIPDDKYYCLFIRKSDSISISVCVLDKKSEASIHAFLASSQISHTGSDSLFLAVNYDAISDMSAGKINLYSYAFAIARNYDPKNDNEKNMRNNLLKMYADQSEKVAVGKNIKK